MTAVILRSWLTALSLTWAAAGAGATSRPPNIVFMLADDLGWFNVGYQQEKYGSAPSELATPAIDALASTGMVLDRMYSYKYCSPSRSSFLSGRLPIHVTQNNKNNCVTNPGGADLRMELLPQRLKAVSPPNASYYTAIVGKWHVGARSVENLPVNRGFDSHFGFLKGGEDHINQHSSDDNLVFVDLWRDRAPAYRENGTFSTIMYTNEAQRVIREHASKRKNRPLFLYLAWHAVHTPLEAPATWNVTPVPNDTAEQTRAKMNALVEVLDQGVRNVTTTLKEEGMWNNTLLVFQADNGGWITNPTLGGNNFPLRGGKVSDFEGGVRNFALVNGGFLPKQLRGSTNKGLAHICDWYATFIALAGAGSASSTVPGHFTADDMRPHLIEVVKETAKGIPPVDALNLWPSLTAQPNSSESPRNEIPLSFCNADAQCDTPSGIGDSALISGDWKIVNGTQGGLGIWQGPRFPNASSVPAAALGCPRGCLFNLRADPYEHDDVKEVHPRVFNTLMARLVDVGKTVYQTNFTVADECLQATVAKKNHHGFLSPRCSHHGGKSSALSPPLPALLPAAFDLRTEYLPSKYALSLGPIPRFSWKVPLIEGKGNRGVDQFAYHLIVRGGTGDKQIVWDSGMVYSNASSLVRFGGKDPLQPDTSYTWTVQWWSSKAFASGVSSVASFDLGLLKAKDWSGAKWIGGEGHRLLRVYVSSSVLTGSIVRARAHVSAPGCVVLSVNGNRHNQSASGICPWTNFNKTIYIFYSACDVLNFLSNRDGL